MNYDTWKSEVEENFIIMPQIESKRGLENVEAIAANPLTTAIAVGPYDLSGDLGVCWKPESEELQTALATIREAGRAAGKNMWMIGDGPTLVERGYTFLCITEPTSFQQTQLTDLNAAVKNRSRQSRADSFQDLAGA